tara:strand:- start:47 stop:406 length:360 start_codon:yes stop_codon:yes gene_type:complete
MLGRMYDTIKTPLLLLSEGSARTKDFSTSALHKIYRADVVVVVVIVMGIVVFFLVIDFESSSNTTELDESEESDDSEEEARRLTGDTSRVVESDAVTSTTKRMDESVLNAGCFGILASM